jgi:GT2 family glycosyltransferase
VSIVICSHNRSADLIECLERLQAQPIGADIEILVVNSGSSNDHSSIIEHYLSARPFVRYSKLAIAGTSAARNHGLEAAKGEWIWWLDDDALPPFDWLDRVLEIVRRVDDQTAVVGGKIVPLFDAGAGTSHLTDRWRLLLSCIEHDEPGNVSEGRNIASANMLMRRKVAQQLGGFSNRFGRGPDQQLTGEESYLLEVIQDAGFGCSYSPTLSVLHKVSSQRLTLEWVGQRSFWEGHVRYRIHEQLGRKPTWSFNPIKLRTSILIFRLLSRLLPNDPDIVIRMNMAMGTLSELSASRRETSAQEGARSGRW